ncbi:MAG: hypothetical protein NZ869_01440 [Thermoanaerobaculum sp.]|nr:hypothetical protein [Thermoanaerobaculum sp.]MDW7966823.1 hypothetical protein [Thermoanaerobaculum sp.]
MAEGLIPAFAWGAGWYCTPEGQPPTDFAAALLTNNPDWDQDDDARGGGRGGDCLAVVPGAWSCSITCGECQGSVGCEAGYACCTCRLLVGPSCTGRPR